MINKLISSCSTLESFFQYWINEGITLTKKIPICRTYDALYSLIFQSIMHNFCLNAFEIRKNIWLELDNPIRSSKTNKSRRKRKFSKERTKVNTWRRGSIPPYEFWKYFCVHDSSLFGFTQVQWNSANENFG